MRKYRRLTPKKTKTYQLMANKIDKKKPSEIEGFFI